MTLATLEPTAALIVIDLQSPILGFPYAHPIQDVVTRTADLARAFRTHGHPVVLATVAALSARRGRTDAPTPPAMPRPAGWDEPLPDLDPHPDDIRVRRQQWGAFLHTDLEQQLHARGTTQVVITGVATAFGVESTARDAADLGLDVVLVTDAMTDLDPQAHTNSIERIFPRLGERTTTHEVLLRLHTEGTSSPRSTGAEGPLIV